MAAANDLTSGPRPERDRATGDGYSVYDLERMLQDIETQPAWRDKSDLCMAYMDGKQLSGERLAIMAETGEPKTIVNLIQRTINGALGNEAKVRLDWKCDADSDVFGDVAEAIGAKLKEAQRETWADMHISEAYKSQLGAGIGWVEVSRNPDPLGYPYRAEFVHRNEVWWDWRGRHMDVNSGQWVCRQRWVDLDEAIAKMPKFRDVFEIGCSSGVLTDAMLNTMARVESFEKLDSARRSFNRFEEEWLDNSTRRRVRFYDVWYKKPKQVVALVSGTMRRPFNPKSPVHQELVRRGMGQLIKGVSFEIRRAMFAGPHRLFDVPTKLRRFPLIPFWCYRDDADATPYGLIHGMIDPQDEYNERRSRLRWLLKASQVFVDNDAVDEQYNTLKDLALEVMRPDGFFVLNHERKNAQGIRVERNLQLAKEQLEVMLDAKQLIQDVPGLYSALLGSGADGVKSGVALNSLVEQSITSLGETNDNYRYGRRGVGEALADLIAEDMTTPDLHVQVGTGKRQRVVVLNTFDPQTQLPKNHVEELAVRIGLSDIPSTAAHRQQQRQEIATTLQGVGDDPIARAVLVPALLESSDLEHREFYAKWARQKYGVPEPVGVDPDTGEDPNAAAEAAQQEAAGQMQQLQMRGAAADVAKKEADAALTQAKAVQAGAQAQGQQLDNQLNAAAAAQPQPPSEDDLIAQSLAEAKQPVAA